MDIEKLMSAPAAERGRTKSLVVSVRRYLHNLAMSFIRMPQPDRVSKRRLDDFADVVESERESAAIARTARSLRSKIFDDLPAGSIQPDPHKQYQMYTE